MNLQIVSITSQGQLTIPSRMRKQLKIGRRTKAVIEVRGNELVVKPKNSFWSLGGSLKSSVTLSNAQLAEARKAFETRWAKQ